MAATDGDSNRLHGVPAVEGILTHLAADLIHYAAAPGVRAVVAVGIPGPPRFRKRAQLDGRIRVPWVGGKNIPQGIGVELPDEIR